MTQYKLREGENIRKPVVKRDRIEIRVPVLLICLALAFLAWLYIVSFSKIDPSGSLDSPPPEASETTSAGIPASHTLPDLLNAVLTPAVDA